MRGEAGMLTSKSVANMKSTINVLIACDCREKDDNHFVHVLRDALQAEGVDVTASAEEFWNPSRRYDIVHFQWPEAVTLGTGRIPLAALAGRIRRFAEEGTKFALTRHNEVSHRSQTEDVRNLYQTVESSCDVVFHMGEYSKNTMPEENRKSGSLHCIVPHFIYPVIPRPDKAESRQMLGMPQSAKLVLAFGEFRSDDERELVLSIGRALRRDRIKVLAPRLFGTSIRGRGKWAACRELRHRLKFLKYGLHLKSCGLVSDMEMSRLFSACDVVLIQRKRILNSGNLPMGFFFGKPVVGPAIGNVGEILQATGNPVFDPDDTDSAANAIREAFALAAKAKGEKNRRYAETRWLPAVCARSIVQAYNQLLFRR